MNLISLSWKVKSLGPEPRPLQWANHSGCPGKSHVPVEELWALEEVPKDTRCYNVLSHFVQQWMTRVGPINQSEDAKL